MTIIKPEIKDFTVRQEGDRVLLLLNGRLVASMPFGAALMLSKALRIKGKQAEEWSNAQAIIDDQAILTRLGVPVGLTNHPLLLKEASIEAAWNSKLRRYIPPSRAGGIASQAIFGTPTIINHGNGGTKDG